MSQISITLPDGSQRQYEAGVTGADIAKSISEGLLRKTISAVVDGDIWDLSRPITKDSAVKFATWDDSEGQYTFWHSSAHIMAEALEVHYPGIKLAYGPPIKEGFYYDIDFGKYSFGSDDFAKVEKTFMELAREGEVFTRKEVTKQFAVDYYREKGNEYKVELIERLADDDTITFYESGKFVDLCKGPHVPTSKIIKAVKLTKMSGAYFLGDETRPQLTRIYGITFPKASDLEEYNTRMEMAKARDHRKLGKEMEIFAFSELVGMGLPLWLPNGAMLRHRLEDFLKRKQAEAGYLPVITPNIGKKDLYVTSGHWDKYGKDSFQPIHTPHEGEEYMLKPMNCPHHCEIYKTKPRSYKDLPIRFAEFGTVYRYEQHGELHGLTRVRGFTQDDAHLFCRPDQLKDEFKKVIDLVLYIFSTLEFNDFSAQISLRDPKNKTKYIGSDELWEKAETAIIEASAEKGLKTIQVEGEAAFYGPKLDFMITDALGRPWQLGTIQVDYNLPERFGLEYVGADNQMHRPVMIHRAPFGSMERFVAVLLEHTGGELPIWLATEQVAILPISERFNNYAEKVLQELKKLDIRAVLDERGEKVGRKIRDAEVRKVPYMVVLGEKEEESHLLAVRKHKHGDIGQMSAEAFAAMIADDVKRSLKLN
ncbi:MAG: threonine--tRNA ligase [Bacteroidetes bacterium]|nr:threonine--tRNA ligase [Bacteroidota bacterium]MBL0015737.1 threonine--tRNA ligase [Bacteroidota bacterium]MBP8073877.1 threonine--tRNA ligase [Bacteroidia bacterium]